MIQVKLVDDYALVTLNKSPVNSLDTGMWSELLRVLDELEKSKCRGLIIQSGLSRNVFSAGNDLMELYAPATTKERYTRFWTLQNQFLSRLLVTPLVTIAAVKGACPAV
jgi:3,2-trans-enoyl-CoA isomerase